MKKNTMNIVMNNIYCTILYILEVSCFSSLIAYGLQYFTTFSPNASFDLIIRLCIGFFVYQIITYIILTNINEIEKENCLKYKTILKKCKLYVSTNNDTVREDILKNVRYEIIQNKLNVDAIRTGYEYLYNNLDNLNGVIIENELINIENLYNTIVSKWRYSYFLRFVKAK